MEKLIDTNEFRSLLKPNLTRFFIHLMGDYLGICLGFLIYFAQPSIFTFIFGSVLIGISQHALAVLGHEAVHRRICKNSALNDIIGNGLCFFPVGITVSTYRDFHLPHHSDPNSNSDPEVPLRKALGKNWLPPFTISRAARLWGASFLGFSLKELIIFVSMLPMGKKTERLMMATVWLAIFIAAIKINLLAYVGLWFFSLATTYFSMLRFQGWFEHSLENKIKTNRYEIQNQLMRLVLPHNIWVHYEHHKYPMIPFYNLEKVRRLDQEEIIYSFSEMLTALEIKNEYSAIIKMDPKKVA